MLDFGFSLPYNMHDQVSLNLEFEKGILVIVMMGWFPYGADSALSAILVYFCHGRNLLPMILATLRFRSSLTYLMMIFYVKWRLNFCKDIVSQPLKMAMVSILLWNISQSSWYWYLFLKHQMPYELNDSVISWARSDWIYGLVESLRTNKW